MKKNLFILLLCSLVLSACKVQQKTTEKIQHKELDPIEVVGKRLEYKGSQERFFDLLHTNLKVSFSWEKQYLYGKAYLDLTPYFYPQSTLILDAKGMEIEKIALVKEDSTLVDLTYTYADKEHLNIHLDKEYKRNEKLRVFIQYIAKPNELESNKNQKLSAIKGRKGLYFINPLGEEKDKPRQIWTQGEPEDNSVWFPTIDQPNERCTQEISITIENNFYAISNGHIKNREDNKDGTYTITWAQKKPHAPYLFMLSIGEYAEIQDEWNGMSVNYYVEPEYKNAAQTIFGNTPEMLSFFSEKLGVPYQWDKYWQIIVRDFVSGAMENTTSVIFGDFVQLDERELLDKNYEDIVAHELFHHWFGDLVTCESWANLPLNESFATYGEVLWKEYKYGKSEGELKVRKDMKDYFREASHGKQVDLIRFRYDKPRDMFDRHSYAKGGVVLHMLRQIVGDEAFFASLQHYLWKHKYQSVEIHDLRIAFEEITGQDLNWFFNQWFLSAGHPIITAQTEYIDSLGIVNIQLSQKPSKDEYLVYRLPMAIDIYVDGIAERKNIVFDRKTQNFYFKVKKKPQLVNIDADKILLAKIKHKKTTEAYQFQFKNAKNLGDKMEAILYFKSQKTKSNTAYKVLRQALQDSFWYVQQQALYAIDSAGITQVGLDAIAHLAENAKNTKVRSKAIYLLADSPKKKSYSAIYEKALKDLSYKVNAAGLYAMANTNKKRAETIAKQWENTDRYSIIDEIAALYSQSTDKSKANFFQKMSHSNKNIYVQQSAIYHYSTFLQKMDNKTILEGIDYIKNWGIDATDKNYNKEVATYALTQVENAVIIKADSYKNVIEQGKKELDEQQKMALESEYSDFLLILNRITTAKEQIEKTKTKK